MLFAYFNESMGSIRGGGGYEPWRSWNKVDVTPILIKNEFTTVPKSGDLFSYTNVSHEFCVVKFSSFG